MTITFESDNDVIVYALENIIIYARDNRYIFVAQSVCWIASIIGLTDRLVTHIDNICILSETYKAPVQEVEQLSLEKEVVIAPRDVQADSAVNSEFSNLHRDRAKQVIKETEEFLNNSKRQRKEFKRKSDPLTRTRSGKIPVKPLTRKQRNRLQAIPKDTLVAFMEGGK